MIGQGIYFIAYLIGLILMKIERAVANSNVVTLRLANVPFWLPTSDR